MYKKYVLETIKSTINAETVGSFVEHNISNSIKFDTSAYKCFGELMVVSVDIKNSQIASDIDDKLKENSIKYENEGFKGKTERLMFAFPIVNYLDVRGEDTLAVLIDDPNNDNKIGVGINEHNVDINDYSELSYSYIESRIIFQELLPILVKILENSNDISGSLGCHVQSIELLNPNLNVDIFSIVFLRNKKPSVEVKGNKDKGFLGTATAEFYVYDGEYLDIIKHTVSFKTDGNMTVELTHKSTPDFSQLPETNNALSCIEKIFFNIIKEELSQKYDSTMLGFFAT